VREIKYEYFDKASAKAIVGMSAAGDFRCENERSTECSDSFQPIESCVILSQLASRAAVQEIWGTDDNQNMNAPNTLS
jgi:hypothetical protein